MKTGRNDPCPCGSGQKYKKCCLAATEPGEAAERQEEQQRLWADDDAAPSEEHGDSAGDIYHEDVARFDASSIRRVTYSSGFARDEEEAYVDEGLRSIVWTAPDIPAAVLECLERERVEELEGEWGDTTSATPIQIEQIDVETDKTVIGLEVFNRALLLVFDNTDETRRLH